MMAFTRAKIKSQALICCAEQTITDRSTYPGKGCIKKEKREKTAKNKEAGSTKTICPRSTSLPRLRLGGL
jgi:hypothetical protein